MEAKLKSGEITQVQGLEGCKRCSFTELPLKAEPDQVEKLGRKAEVLKEIFALEMIVH